MPSQAEPAQKFSRLLAWIVGAALLLYLIGNQSVALWDRDEPRYAQCSRQMLQSGDWVVPRFLDKWRYEKPPLIYWFQAISMKILGDTGFAARLPSAIAAALTALLLGAVVRHFVGTARALWTVLIFCTSGLVIGAAKMCITDAVLMAFVAAGQACLAILWFFGRDRYRSRLWQQADFPPGDFAAKGLPPAWVAPAFWAATGLAGLAKGPQALGMHIVLILVLLLLDLQGRWSSPSAWRDCLRWLKLTRPLIGLPILAAIVLPWIFLIHIRAEGFLSRMLDIARQHTATDLEGHGQPPGYHALLIFGTFYPWSLLLPTAISLAYQHRRTPAIRFAIAAVLGPWLLMECVTVKLPFYVLPVFPALSFLTADALIRCRRGQHRDLKNLSFLVATIIWGLATLGLAAAPWASLLATNEGLPRRAMIAYSACGVIYVAAVMTAFWARRFAVAAIVMGTGMAIMIAILFSAVLPNLGFLRMSQRIAADLKNHGGYGPSQRVAMIGYREPSLAFYQGGGTREQDNDYYLQFYPPDQWAPWIVIDQDNLNEMRPYVRQHLIPIGAETGVAYSVHGTRQRVLVFKTSAATLPSK